MVIKHIVNIIFKQYIIIYGNVDNWQGYRNKCVFIIYIV